MLKKLIFDFFDEFDCSVVIFVCIRGNVYILLRVYINFFMKSVKWFILMVLDR